jgi:hypothetical protein
MTEKEAFKKSIEISLNVASLGIYKEDWYIHKPGVSQSEVKEKMKSKSYDIVPIENKMGIISSYYFYNQSIDNIQTQNIKDEDKLYYLTHVRDAIWKLRKEKRQFYFLSNGRHENDLVGLLSLSDFNCKEFYVFLFSLIAYIEREFAKLIEIEEKVAFEILSKKSDSKELKEQLNNISQRIEDDKKKNIDHDFKEYLYIHHLIWLISSEQKYKALKYKSESDFVKNTGKFKEIRNNVAHPVRSLIRTTDDLENIDKGLNKLYELKERLDEYLN